MGRKREVHPGRSVRTPYTTNFEESEDAVKNKVEEQQKEEQKRRQNKMTICQALIYN